jgi:hypothetical protein
MEANASSWLDEVLRGEKSTAQAASETAASADDAEGGLGFMGAERSIGPKSHPQSRPSAETAPGTVIAALDSPRTAETISCAARSIPIAGSAGDEIFIQTFGADAAGARPSGWAGEYPYATLTVENQTPPAGSIHYLAYVKKAGVGKVYFSTRFPKLDGIIDVQFDLRCDDKNKFLLGFYIEKDEDFQQAIHTKILRSESQTAPSIHVHGQPAPYIMGQWVHVRYLIDLTQGEVEGYLDGRHVARRIRLPKTPMHLNTLAIRDNINTTGRLCLGNIRVRKVA